MTDLVYISATEALRRFRRRELSPVELLTALVERAERVEPVINALCHTGYDEALAQARQAEARYAGKGEAPRALEGIPVALKEEEPVAGQPLTQGSLIDSDLVADHTSTLAQRVLDAGGIVHARTTMPEYGAAGFTQSRLWGITRNPWNPDYSPGGSSGGSGASLAAGTTTLASGSDIGGSIRIPAAFCGVVGYKPPYGRVPAEPPFNLDTYNHSGPMARTVADAVLLQNVIAGPDGRDIAAVAPKVEVPSELGDVRGLRVALSVDLGDWPVDPEVRANTLAVADRLRAAGAVVEEVGLALPAERVMRAAAIHYCAGGIDLLDGLVNEHRELVTPYLVHGAARLQELAEGGSLIEGYAIEADLFASLSVVFESFDVLICPTNGSTGLLADTDYTDGTPIDVDGISYLDTFDIALTMPFNVLSRCPVLAMPSGRASNGVPTGVQVVGRPFADEIVFRVGAAIDCERAWFDAPERRPDLGRLTETTKPGVS